MDAHLTEGGRWLHGCFWDGCLQARQLAPLISHSYEALDDGRFGGHSDHLDDNKNGNSRRRYVFIHQPSSKLVIKVTSHTFTTDVFWPGAGWKVGGAAILMTESFSMLLIPVAAGT